MNVSYTFDKRDCLVRKQDNLSDEFDDVNDIEETEKIFWNLPLEPLSYNLES